MNTDTTHFLEIESRSAARAGLLHGIVAAAGTRDTLDILWSWGYASVYPEKIPMNTDSVFDIASVTKAVATASACGVCIDRGLLVPDAPAANYLPAMGQLQGSTIRVSDLATHCSGYDNRKFDFCDPGDLLNRAIDMPAQWPVRQVFEYSCRNFLLLGAIVESVSGEPLSDFCRNNVFLPAEMEATNFGPLTSGLEKAVPSSQIAGIISDEQARKAGKPVGNAGLFSTAGDLVSFCRMMLNAGKARKIPVLEAKSMKWLTEPCSPRHLPRKSFGWDMSSCDECLHRPFGLSEKAFGHSGWTGQSVWIDPGLNLFTIILTNRTHALRTADNYEASKRFRARIAEILISHLKT